MKNLLHIILSVSAIITLHMACEKIPDRPENPDNPLDPNNPKSGSAFILSPTKLTIEASEQFQLELWVSNVDPIAGISSKIYFNNVSFNVDSIDFLMVNSESFLLQNGGELLTFSQVNYDSGFISLDCAVVEGSPRDVAGTGKVVRIIFTHKSGSPIKLEISQEGTILRNSRNEAVYIDNFIGSEVTIKY